jgi:predicted DNA-binding protein
MSEQIIEILSDQINWLRELVEKQQETIADLALAEEVVDEASPPATDTPMPL